jgi:hypothetical protein
VYRCPECGFSYELAAAPSAGVRISEGAATMADLLERGGPSIRSRPSPAVWSVLEYGCHVRDVLLVQRDRVYAARLVERPACHSMGRDERVDYDGYGAQDPADVARQLRDAALLFANALARLDDVAWERTLEYHYPEPRERTLRWVAVHTVHEVRHHLGDVRAQLPA